LNIEERVLDYQKSKSEDVFNQIYQFIKDTLIEGKNKSSYFKSVAYNTKTSHHDVVATFDDTVLESLKKYKEGNSFINYFKWLWKRRITNLYKKEKSLRDMTVYDDGLTSSDDGEEELNSLENISVSRSDETELCIIVKEQRQLVDHLIRGENERTTAIVQTFLSTNMTPTAIGKHLGLHHVVVKRALTRLAAKHDTKQFGSHRDYLVAL